MLLKSIEDCIFQLNQDIELLEATLNIFDDDKSETSQAILKDKRAIDILNEIYSC